MHKHIKDNPVACAAAFEVQQIIRNDCLVDNVATMGKLLEQGLKSMLEHPHVGNIRGRGPFWGIEFVQDKVTKQAFDPQISIAKRVHETGMQEPSGTGSADGILGDHVLLAPAYNVTDTKLTVSSVRLPRLSKKCLRVWRADPRV